MFRTLDISTSGLVAQRQRLNTIAGNIANINTTRGPDGQPAPFQRRLVTLSAAEDAADGNRTGAGPAGGIGVRYQVEIDDSQPPRFIHNPGHPDADARGNVAYPDINLTTEFVNAIEASRAYEANVAAIDMTKAILGQTLKILA